jgi:hypothetical protein
MRLRTGRWNRAVALLLGTFLFVPTFAISDDQVEPPKICLSLAALPQLPPPTATIPDIPWQPPAPRPDAKTPFAPKFLSGNNIFAGEKEYWLADAVADTELHWPRRFSDPLINHYLTDVPQNLDAIRTNQRSTMTLAWLIRGPRMRLRLVEAGSTLPEACCVK